MDGYIFTALYFQLGGVAAYYFIFFFCKRKWHIYTELFFFVFGLFWKYMIRLTFAIAIVAFVFYL